MTHDPPATPRTEGDERCPTCGAGPNELHDPRRHDPALDERLPADNELDEQAYDDARSRAREDE